MNEQTQIDLAKKNQVTNLLYIQKVRQGVKQIYEKEDELAILRKAVAYLFELISVLHDGQLTNDEFVKYNTLIEKLKSDIKIKLNTEEQINE